MSALADHGISLEEVLDNPLAQVAPPIPDRVLQEMFDVQPDNSRVLVEAHLPHVSDYGHNPMVSLVYGWKGGPLAVGDLVLCPGTPLRPSPFQAIVVSLDASMHPYKGRVKYIIKRIGDDDGDGA